MAPAMLSPRGMGWDSKLALFVPDFPKRYNIYDWAITHDLT